MNRQTIRSGATALAALVTLALGMAMLVFAPSAYAANGNIDFAREGSITIHKYENPTWNGVSNDGSQQTAPGDAVPLEGVQFSVQKVDIDLSDATKWDNLAGITYNKDDDKAEIGGAQYALQADVAPAATNNAGTTTAGNLTPGVYLVKETDFGKNNIVKAVDPFFVVIPQKTATNEWNYDVHVYPKNTVANKPVKEVDDAAAVKAGDTITWTISADMPKGDSASTGAELTNVVFADTLTDKLEAPQQDSVVVAVMAGDDEMAPADYVVAVSGQEVTVTLQGDGLTKAQGKKVSVKLSTTVKATAEADAEPIGEISNTATVSINDATPVASEPVAATQWGKVVVTKTDADDSTKMLEGAEFGVYDTEEKATAAADGTEISKIVTDANGKAFLDLKNGTYYVKELKAPAGYVVDTEVKTITVAQNSVDLSVTNTKQALPGLPVTGASGQLLLTLAGISVLAVAAGLVLVMVRRRHQN